MLVAQTGVHAGFSNTLRLWTGDVGDSHFDTTLFVDNVRIFPMSPCPTLTKGPSLIKKIKARVSGGKATVRGQVLPAIEGGKVLLTLLGNGSPMKRVARKKDTLDSQGKFRKRFGVPSDSTRCMVKVNFKGDAGHFPSTGKKRFRC
jgi:hypothetical protein